MSMTRVPSSIRLVLAPAAARSGNGEAVTDVCEELGISKSTFYDWRAARKAPARIKLPNGGIRIRRVVFDRWLASREEHT